MGSGAGLKQNKQIIVCCIAAVAADVDSSLELLHQEACNGRFFTTKTEGVRDRVRGTASPQLMMIRMAFLLAKVSRKMSIIVPASDCLACRDNTTAPGSPRP